MLECASLASDGRGHQKSLFVSIFFPLRWLPPHPSPDMIFFQHDRPWPVSVFPLMEHDAHKRMFFYLVELHGFLIDLFSNRMRLCMGAPIMVPSFFSVPILRLSCIDILWFGIRLLSTNCQPQSFRMPNQHFW